MAFYVPKREIPKDCRECWFNNYLPFSGETYCDAGEFMLADSCKPLPFEGRHPDCPLIKVPPHGRLIDADALGEFPYNMDFCDGGEADEWIRNAPTVIPASGKEAAT